MALKTKNRGVLKADEISALKSKYDDALNRQDYFKYVIMPGLLVAIYGLITTYSWWVTLIMFFIGAFYGFRKILPAIVEQDYYYNALSARDSFCINMTQILSDPTRTMPSALARSVDRTKGELKKDLLVLQANVTGSSREQVIEAFANVREKYAEDISFTQYLEQLETIYLSGKIDLAPLKDISSQHQDIMKKQYQFQEYKDTSWKGVKRLIIITVAIILVLEFSFGFKVSYEAYCRSIPGWITSAIYVSLILMNLVQFRKVYFDSDVMSIKRKVKG